MNTVKTQSGEYDLHAAISQGIKREMENSPNWEELDDSMKESLQLIAFNIARVLSGDPKNLIFWRDIQTYAQLVEGQLNGNTQA